MRQTVVGDNNNKEKTKKGKLLCAKKHQKKKKKKMLYPNYNEGQYIYIWIFYFICSWDCHDCIAN